MVLLLQSPRRTSSCLLITATLSVYKHLPLQLAHTSHRSLGSKPPVSHGTTPTHGCSNCSCYSPVSGGGNTSLDLFDESGLVGDDNVKLSLNFEEETQAVRKKPKYVKSKESLIQDNHSMYRVDFMSSFNNNMMT